MRKYQSANGSVHGFEDGKTYCGMQKSVKPEGFGKHIDAMRITCMKCKKKYPRRV